MDQLSTSGELLDMKNNILSSLDQSEDSAIGDSGSTSNYNRQPPVSDQVHV